jgi:hypothetical protein
MTTANAEIAAELGIPRTTEQRRALTARDSAAKPQGGLTEAFELMQPPDRVAAEAPRWRSGVRAACGGTGSGRVLRQQHSTSYGLVCSEEIRMALWDR